MKKMFRKIKSENRERSKTNHSNFGDDLVQRPNPRILNKFLNTFFKSGTMPLSPKISYRLLWPGSSTVFGEDLRSVVAASFQSKNTGKYYCLRAYRG